MEDRMDWRLSELTHISTASHQNGQWRQQQHQHTPPHPWTCQLHVSQLFCNSVG